MRFKECVDVYILRKKERLFFEISEMFGVGKQLMPVGLVMVWDGE